MQLLCKFKVIPKLYFKKFNKSLLKQIKQDIKLSKMHTYIKRHNNQIQRVTGQLRKSEYEWARIKLIFSNFWLISLEELMVMKISLFFRDVLT